MVEIRDYLSEEEIRQLLRRIHKKWKEDADPSDISLSFLEARSVGYGLEKDTELGFAYYIHYILEKADNWTPSCLKGFLHSTLRLWNEINPAVREANSSFLSRHSHDVEGALASVAPYISANGPTQLGIDTRMQKKSFLWATASVLMPTTRLNYSYFSDTIISYFQNAKQEEYGDLLSALNIHNQTRTDKILIPLLVKKSSSFNKDLLEIATKRIGDPFDEAKWAPFDGATEEQKKALLQVRRILLGWIMQEIIRAFFDLLCHDRERKNCWSKHAHQITDFIVFGSVWSRSKVMGSLPAQSVNKHFKTVESSVDNCALAMYFGDYVIIEFTEVGALYAYKVGSPNYRQAFRNINHLNKIDDLKITSIPLLYDLDYHRFAREGKMDHRGFWDRRINDWIDHQIVPTLDKE